MISIRCTADSAACDSGGSTHGVADGEHGDGDVDGTTLQQCRPPFLCLSVRVLYPLNYGQRSSADRPQSPTLGSLRILCTRCFVGMVN